MKENIYGIIYKVTNKVDKKVYIGQTSVKGGFDRRYKHNLEKYTSNIHLKRAIEKYGIENFTIDKEFDIAYSKEELDELEIKYIREFNTTNPEYGYNLQTGGSNGKLAEETKQKLREANLGKRYSDEINRKKALPGEKNGMYGKTHSIEAKKIMSKKLRGKYVGKKSAVHQKIKCTTTGKEFETAKEAGQYYGIKSYSHISRCCYGSLKHCGKLVDGTPLEWEFVNPTVQKMLRENEGRKKGSDKKRKYIVCLNDGNIFKGQNSTGKFYNIKSAHHISDVCLGKSEFCGSHPITLEPLKFVYLCDYPKYLYKYLFNLDKHLDKLINLMINYNDTELKIPDKRGRKAIICLNDCKFFKSKKEAGEYYNIKSAHHISDVCLGKCEFCGSHPVTLEPLRFIYFQDLSTYLESILKYLTIRKMILDKYLNNE